MALTVDDVFRAYGLPEHTFIKRQKVFKDVIMALQQHGVSLFVHGRSASGKTCIVKRAFTIMGIESFDVNLGPKESRSSILTEIVKRLIAETGIKGLNYRNAKIDSVGHAIDLIFKCLEKKPLSILIDDAHKFHAEFISDFVKAFNQRLMGHPKLNCQLVVIGIDLEYEDLQATRPREMLRVIGVDIPIFSNKEILEIVTLGAKALETEISDVMKNDIVNFSNGRPSTCQAISSLIFKAAEIDERKPKDRVVNRAVWVVAADNYQSLYGSKYAPKLLEARSVTLVTITGEMVLHGMVDLQNNRDNRIGNLAVNIEYLHQYLSENQDIGDFSEFKTCVDILTRPEGGEVLRVNVYDEVLFTEPIYRLLYDGQVGDVEVTDAFVEGLMRGTMLNE